MSYVNKKLKVFEEGPKTMVVLSRSEARIKRYISAIDARAWCDTVEERRQHILEYTAKTKDSFCLPKVIPLEVLFNAMMTRMNCEIRKLEREADYKGQQVETYLKIGLTEEQQNQLNDLLRRNGMS